MRGGPHCIGGPSAVAGEVHVAAQRLEHRVVAGHVRDARAPWPRCSTRSARSRARAASRSRCPGPRGARAWCWCRTRRRRSSRIRRREQRRPSALLQVRARWPPCRRWARRSSCADPRRRPGGRCSGSDRPRVCGSGVGVGSTRITRQPRCTKRSVAYDMLSACSTLRTTGDARSSATQNLTGSR